MEGSGSWDFVAEISEPDANDLSALLIGQTICDECRLIINQKGVCTQFQYQHQQRTDSLSRLGQRG